MRQCGIVIELAAFAFGSIIVTLTFYFNVGNSFKQFLAENQDGRSSLQLFLNCVYKLLQNNLCKLEI
jgi:hypothetical protein